jgi:hypothetical protein
VTDAVVTRFGLTRMPFGRDLPPSRLHRHADCAEAAARITWAVAGKTIGVVTGEVGTGKTAAVRAAVAGLDPAGHAVIYVGNPTAGTRGILSAVVTALGGRPVHGIAALGAQAWGVLAGGVLAGEAAERGRTPVLVIDLCRLRDYAVPSSGGCVLAGRAVPCRDGSRAAGIIRGFPGRRGAGRVAGSGLARCRRARCGRSRVP